MNLGASFRTLIEDAPGPLWQAHFEALWPGYQSWFLRGGAGFDRPGYLESRRALREHMPELVPTWSRLVDLAGGSDVAARFLSMWCPPPYIGGCAQAVWTDATGAEPPALLRNYDFAPLLLEASWLATRWSGPRVLAMGDCLWGALDGINEAGLCAALSFGGRNVNGPGFGIPLVLRYLLEVAQDTPEAVRLLQRVPVSMCYSVTLLDRRGQWATVFVAPDRTAEATGQRAITNLQHRVEWPAYERATHATQRRDHLQALIDGPATLAEASQALLQPPLFQTDHLSGHGTLYSAVYRPAHGSVSLMWPAQQWTQSVRQFSADQRRVEFAADPPRRDLA